MEKRSLRSPQQGFTLVEMIVVLAIIMIIALLGFPALMNTIRRAKVEGAVREAATLGRAARLQAIKGSQAAGLYSDFTGRKVVYFIDSDASGDFDATLDDQKASVLLPSHTSFGGPAADSDKVTGLGNDGSGGWVLFGSDGTSSATGAFRIGDDHGNYYEIRIDPKATGRIDILKWNPTASAWRAQGQNGESWQWY